MNARSILAVVAVAALFLVMVFSLVGIPWPTESHFIPVTGNETAGNTTANATSNTLTGSLFGSYPVTLILIALVLAASMIGGVYLSKMEGGKLGP